MYPFQVFGYYRSGSETESTLLDNRAAYSRYKLMPRLMVDVSNIDTTCTLLGVDLTLTIALSTNASFRQPFRASPRR